MYGLFHALLENLSYLLVVMTDGGGGGGNGGGVQVSREAWPGNNLYFPRWLFVERQASQVAQSAGVV